jgi:hypothetical protein
VGDGQTGGWAFHVSACAKLPRGSEKNSPEKVTGVGTDINYLSDLPRFSMGKFKEKAAAADCLIGECPGEDDAGVSDGGL